ncbi:hypothetical protein APHAL10511_004253 [Amanita phalloides]|nr:hypothetical protein APHAL10511_004253 [Amanita phalloides]
MATSSQRLKKVLKSAARLPVRAVIGSGSLAVPFSGRGCHALTPVPGETPIIILRLQVVSCTGLLSNHRNGFNDPFIVVSLLHSKHTTPTCKRTLNPVFPARESTFDFPIYLSVVERRGGVGVVELVVWDRDLLLKKDYLGEVGVGLDGWFACGSEGDKERTVLAWDDAGNKPFSLELESTRANTAATGSVKVKLGFVSPPNTANLMDFNEVLKELRKREVKTGRASWVSAPPTEGVGTIRSHHHHSGHPAVYEDDGGISSTDEYEPEDEGSEVEVEGEPEEGEEEQDPSTAGLPKLNIQAESPTTPTAAPVTFSPLSTAMPSSLARALVPPPTAAPGLRAPSALSPVVDKSDDDSPSPPDTMARSAPPSPVVAPSLLSTKSGTGFIPKMKFPRRMINARDTSKSPSVSPTSSSASDGMAAAGGSSWKNKAKEKKRRVFRKRWSTGSQSAPALAVAGTNEAQVGGHKGTASESIGAPISVAHGPTPTTGKGGYMFEAGADIVGIVMLEIIKAENLPRLKNVTRTGFDMDPFVVVSFGKKVFRTRVLRHTLNPIWDEKLLFHVRQYETAYQVQLTILDWDKLSSNDLVGNASFDVNTLIETAPQPDPITGLYAPDYGGDHPTKEIELELTMAKDIPWELTQDNTPTITIRAKYQPYAAMRQRFWRQYLNQYEMDDSGGISLLELTAMLDSLGSTLTKSTIETFFVRFGKKMEEDELTVDEAIQCLETELCKPFSEKKKVNVDGEGHTNGSSVSATPILIMMDKMGKELGGVPLALDQLDFSGRPAHPHPEHHQWFSLGEDDQRSEHQFVQSLERMLEQGHLDEDTLVALPYPSESNQVPLSIETPSPSSTPGTGVESSEEEESGTSSGPGVISTSATTADSDVGQKKSRFRQIRRKKAKQSNEASNSGSTGANARPNEAQVERVINVKNCPLCHRPRLNSKADMDIVTHLAVCASQDWNQVDRIVVGNFVTASQAQRKWYTNMLGKISAGGYKLGANSANIIVQNRTTGQLEEEKMQVYVKLGIRLLYKGAKGRMEGSRARKLLKSLTIKQGIKYDSQESVKEIPAFIQFHQLNVDEILEPIESFKSFNQFFYRKLKPGARPMEQPDDPYRLVSVADCRLMTFDTVNEATNIWIKGREFSVARLLGDAYKDEAEKYVGGALGIFRLAPQDYHRFHSPVDGTIGRMTYISGEYYTVNPQAIRTALDVYGENVRKIVPIDSPQFGRVMAVCIGAMMVGTIKTTVEEGEQVRRGQEFGYFAFGGSTIVLLFEKGVLEWDEDLLINGRASLETLVRFGMGIGRGRRPAPS